MRTNEAGVLREAVQFRLHALLVAWILTVRTSMEV